MVKRVAAAWLWLLKAPAVAATRLEVSRYSDLVAPVTAGGVETWMSLTMTETESRFWSHDRCPPGIACVPVEAERVPVAFSAALAETVLVAAAYGERPRFAFRDVCGTLGIGPASDFARSRILTFRKRDGVVSLELERRFRVPSGGRIFSLSPPGPGWRIDGRVEFDNGITSRVVASGVEIDLARAHTTLPRDALPSLQASWLDTRDPTAILVDCQYERRLLLMFVLRGNNEPFSVPVGWTKKPVKTIKGMDYCRLSIDWGDSALVTLGRDFLDSFDVGLDGKDRAVALLPRLAYVGPAPARVRSLPDAVYFESIVCTASERETLCTLAPAESALSARFLLVALTATDVTLVRLGGAARLHLQDIPGHWYRAPVVHKLSDGSWVLRASRQENHSYEFVFRDSPHRLRFGWFKFTDAAPSLCERKRRLDASPEQPKCLLCHEPVTKGQNQMRLMGCNHDFHRNCIGRWMDKSRSCPGCSREIPSGIGND